MGNVPYAQCNHDALAAVLGEDRVRTIICRLKEDGEERNKSWAYVTLMNQATVAYVLQAEFRMGAAGQSHLLSVQLPKGAREGGGKACEITSAVSMIHRSQSNFPIEPTEPEQQGEAAAAEEGAAVDGAAAEEGAATERAKEKNFAHPKLLVLARRELHVAR